VDAITAKADKCAQNNILSRLKPDDLALLRPHLQNIELPVRTRLEQRKRKIEFVYFIESGIASVVAEGDQQVEIGIIGREGITGVAFILGADRPKAHQTFVQVAATAKRIRVDRLRAAMDASPMLTRSLLLYVYSFLNQISQAVLANAQGSIAERLARWLLMVDDRIDDSRVELTHEFLAVMLATRRPGVTLALKELHRRGAIEQSRGAITIIDRQMLEKIAGKTYVKSC
jgi:CRP-like cAMP-binding protein